MLRTVVIQGNKNPTFQGNAHEPCQVTQPQSEASGHNSLAGEKKTECSLRKGRKKAKIEYGAIQNIIYVLE